MKMGMMKRYHWFGWGDWSALLKVGFGTPPKPQTSDSGQNWSFCVAFGQRKRTGMVDPWISLMLCMQGVYRAPMLIMTCVEGPIMGLN